MFDVLRDTETMGSESVELVRRVYRAWQAGDLEELLSLVDREVSWSPVLRFLEGERAAVGHQGLRRWFRRIRITYCALVVVRIAQVTGRVVAVRILTANTCPKGARPPRVVTRNAVPPAAKLRDEALFTIETSAQTRPTRPTWRWQRS